MSAPDAFETTARQYEDAAAELEIAAQHLRVTADHFRAREVPSGCAHAWAATGHVRNAEAWLAEHARLHAAKSSAT